MVQVKRNTPTTSSGLLKRINGWFPVILYIGEVSINSRSIINIFMHMVFLQPASVRLATVGPHRATSHVLILSSIQLLMPVGLLIPLIFSKDLLHQV